MLDACRALRGPAKVAAASKAASMPRKRSLVRAAQYLVSGALCAGFAMVQIADAQSRTSPPASEVWKILAPMLEPQCEGGTVVLNGRIYVMGGWKDEPHPFRLVQIYDVASNKWSRGVPLPEPIHHEGVAVVEGKIYVIGGFQQPFPRRKPIDHVWEFDPVANKWTARAPLPSPRGALVVQAIGDLIYAAGGEGYRPKGASLAPPGSPPAYLPVANLAVYDTATNKWRSLPPMHVRRDHAYGAVIDGRLYVAGGRDRPDYTLTALEEYDPSSNVWSERAALPTGRSGGNGAALGGRFYTFGGEGDKASASGVFDNVEAYDPARDSWKRYEPMDHPRHSLSAAAVGASIYLSGGVPHAGGVGVVSMVESFQPR
jgi:N-acetylneuraminic acid mutarotase